MPGPLHVLIATDKFKGSASAAEVAAALSEGLRQSRPGMAIAVCPVADGGDGTLAAAEAADFTRIEVTATGPAGVPVTTAYARRGEVAVVEMASVSGLALLPVDGLAPLTASSRGTGEVIAAALDAGCRQIVLGIGGSACTDGGAGLVSALGASVRETSGAPLADGGGALADVAALDPTALRERLAGVTVTVACDVDNPLTGPRGAAAVYGPQKGADDRQVRDLDAALTRWADVVAETTGEDHRDAAGAGAAGGVGFAAIALMGAELRSGIDLLLDLVDFEDLLAGADLVVTGEGSLDEQTLHGKAVAGVAARAGERGIPVVAVCGRNTLTEADLRSSGVRAAYALTDLEPDVERCIAEPLPLLRRLGEQIAADHLAEPAKGYS